MKKIMDTGMRISLDTNIWIFGLFESNIFCQKIIDHLSQFEIVVPNQIRRELERNLPELYLKRFYRIVKQTDATISYDPVPDRYVTLFESKGLKKGDAIIGGFCEWRKIDTIISDNRDFLRGLSADHHFAVMSPEAFCQEFHLV